MRLVCKTVRCISWCRTEYMIFQTGRCIFDVRLDVSYILSDKAIEKHRKSFSFPMNMKGIAIDVLLFHINSNFYACLKVERFPHIYLFAQIKGNSRVYFSLIRSIFFIQIFKSPPKILSMILFPENSTFRRVIHFSIIVCKLLYFGST